MPTSYPCILTLDFSRDVCIHYSTDEGLRADLAEMDGTWSVIGKYDFLAIQASHRLTDIVDFFPGCDNGTSENTGISVGARSGLALVPFDDFFDEAEQEHDEYQSFISTIVERHTTGEARWPLLIVARIYLSPVAYELASDYSAVLTAIQSARDMLQKLASDYREQGLPLPASSEFRFFQTLGSPDIVLLARPTTPEELASVYHFLALARQLQLQSLAEIANTMISVNPDKLDSCPGHAFTAINETLCFRCQGRVADLTENNPAFLYWRSDHAEKSAEDRVKSFRESEQRVGFRLDFELQLDCGHDDEVVDAHRKVLDGALEESRRFGGLYTLRGSFHHFDEFAKVWQKLWFKPTFRLANMMDTVSTLSFKAEPYEFVKSGSLWHNRTDQPTRPAWQLVGGLQRELSKIEFHLDRWSREFLSPEQRQELLNIVRTFRGCFFHLERASSPRDLLPFMRQLACACSLHDYWRAFRKTPEGNIEEFNEEVVRLLGHLHRAVRNRLEHRTHHADPTIPHTLEHGASKLISAYTTVYWLCGELYSKSPSAQTPGNTNAYCIADRLAVCVAAGNEGRVSFEEIFQEFRLFVESHELDAVGKAQPRSQPISIVILNPAAGLFDECWSDDDKQLHSSGWISRLLLLDISGWPLFRPEHCLLHGLHETAQSSDWYESSELAWLRSRLNLWLVEEIRSIIGRCATVNYIQKMIPDTGGLSSSLISELCRAEPPDHPLAAEIHTRRGQFSRRLAQLRKFLEVLLPDLLTGLNLGVTSFREFLQSKDPRTILSDEMPKLWESLRDITLWRESFLKDKRNDSRYPFEQLPLAAEYVISTRGSDYFSDQWENLEAIAKEVSGDIGRIAVFQYLLNSFKKYQDKSRHADLNVMFVGIINTALHRYGNSPTKGDEWALFLLRWCFALSLAGQPDPARHISEYIEHLRQQRSPENDKLLTAWDNNKSLELLAMLMENHPFLLPNPVGTGNSLSEQLNRVQIAREDRLGVSCLQENSPQSSPAERELFRLFAETWSEARKKDSFQLLRSRLRLIMNLWAKSTRLRIESGFSKIEKKQTNGVSKVDSN